MGLRLEPYDPDGDLKVRAARAFATLGAEFRAQESPKIDVGPDAIDRLNARTAAYRKTKAFQDRERYNRKQRYLKFKEALKNGHSAGKGHRLAPVHRRR